MTASLLVDRRPAATVGELDADPTQHEGAVRVVLELLLGIDPAADRDEPRRSGGQLAGLRHRHDRCHREEPSDSVIRPEVRRIATPMPSATKPTTIGIRVTAATIPARP